MPCKTPGNSTLTQPLRTANLQSKSKLPGSEDGFSTLNRDVGNTCQIENPNPLNNFHVCQESMDETVGGCSIRCRHFDFTKMGLVDWSNCLSTSGINIPAQMHLMENGVMLMSSDVFSSPRMRYYWAFPSSKHVRYQGHLAGIQLFSDWLWYSTSAFLTMGVNSAKRSQVRSGSSFAKRWFGPTF